MKTRILLALLLTIAALLGILAWSHVRVAKTSVGDPHIESADAGKRSTEELSALPATPVSERQAAERVPSSAPTPIPPGRMGTGARETVVNPPEVRHISGTVTSAATGFALAGAMLTASAKFADTSFQITDGERGSARSDRTGHFEMDVAPAAFQITCTAVGYAERKQIVDARTSDVVIDFAIPAKPPTMDALIRLTTAEGRPFLATLEPADRKRFSSLRPVFAAGNVARGACASGLSVFSVQSRSVESGGQGGAWFRATVQTIASGSCCLVMGDRVIDVAPFDMHTTEITLVASIDDLHGAEGSVRMLVVDKATGRPFPGAHVRVVSDMAAEKRGIAGNDGVLIVEHVMEGEARVSITSFDPDRPGETRFQSEFRTGAFRTAPELSEGEVRSACVVQGGRQTDLGRIQLDRTVSISGHVVLVPNDATLPTVMVFQQSDDDTPDVGHGPDMLGAPFGEVEKDGAFRFSGLRPGWYIVTASLRDASPFEPEVHSGPVRTKSVEIDARYGDVSQLHIDSPADAEEWLQPRVLIREPR